VENFRKVGENCVLRGIVNNNVWVSQSVIVVKDEQKETILLLLPGAQCAIPEGYARWRVKKDFSHGTRWQEAKSNHIKLLESPWKTNRVLIFLEPEKFYSIFLFWDHESDQFGCYYINFQLPYRRSHCGFDTLDLDLDIVIDPQYKWKWKDLDHYQAGIQEGGIQDEWVSGIEESKSEVIERINNREYPLDGSWLKWRPEITWKPPALPNNWEKI